MSEFSGPNSKDFWKAVNKAESNKAGISTGPGILYEYGCKAQKLEQELVEMREALHDAIRRPMGVVPASAERWIDQEKLEEAEQRRINEDSAT
jgi:hypothetical protein